MRCRSVRRTGNHRSASAVEPHDAIAVRGYLRNVTGGRPNACHSVNDAHTVTSPGSPVSILTRLFAQLGIRIGSSTLIPIITQVTSRACLPDPATREDVFNPGILFVSVDIGFIPIGPYDPTWLVQLTDAQGNYERDVTPGIAQRGGLVDPARSQHGQRWGVHLESDGAGHAAGAHPGERRRRSDGDGLEQWERDHPMIGLPASA